MSMNKFSIGLIIGVVVAIGATAFKVNSVCKKHDEALELFDKEFTALLGLVKSGLLTVEEGLKEYEVVHARAAERCLAHTLDRKATEIWLADMHKVNIGLIKMTLADS
jgi:hypothetical protein